MKNKKSIFGILSLTFLLAFLSVPQTYAQPSEAQIKKVLTNAKTVSVTLGSVNGIEWSSTYKKYIWSRNFTARLKTDTPGEILVVKGYAAYDVMGGRYVYWRTFTSGNSYEGKKNPTAEEINQALEASARNFLRGGGREIVGEYESLRLAPDADWEWHTPNSVSFNVVAVYNVIYRGEHYDNEREQYEHKPGFEAVDKIETLMRLRLYRDDEKSAWNSVSVSRSIRDAQNHNLLKDVKKLLERRELPAAEVKGMPRPSKVPQLTQ